LEDALADAKSTARDQLQAASQIHLDRVMEALSSGWHTNIERVFEERLSELALRMEAHLRGQVEVDRARIQAAARREMADRLNQATRRLRHFENEEHWSQSLIQSTDGLCQRAALFVVNQGNLEFRAGRNLDKLEGDPIALTAAPAFASAVETKDTVIAMRTRGELSERIATLTGEDARGRCYLLPLQTRERVAAILYADSLEGPVEASALELLATLGGSVLDAVNSVPRAANLVKPALTKQEDDLHLKAQRFARVKVAEMRLYKSQAVKEGRGGQDLYAHLKHEIDAGRKAYADEFLKASKSMTDYFHLELVRTLANDDASLLGPDYPGPMA
jgi:hypothetical protein